MNKKLICSIIAAVLATTTTAPLTVSAAELKGDLDKDNIISYEDVNDLNTYIKAEKKYKADYDVNGDGVLNQKDVDALALQVVPTGIVGDVNDDGVVSAEDWNLQLNNMHKSSTKRIETPQGNYVIVYDLKDSGYYFDAKNADLDGNGYVGPEDLYVPINQTKIKGDVNADGKVDYKDYVLLRKFINKTDEKLEVRIDGDNAKLNDDNIIDIVDLAELRHMVK